MAQVFMGQVPFRHPINSIKTLEET